ncbi:hypothetical protein DICPUDRAFT_157324 [Dictyostelium purpureum]|uniref:Uncharacterized protein n=1 Tax=Dictyostelium purpureum TaxID=5786 RepID=F0ZYU6_DICPU|nr:uncharacterized protein DICPUDRAFT_157324 [Dictyostelium purpureum]EGC30881.1 hypothetical protein DICPUDRAFT_157324 [Dictyostelium purpureum]|eukprot:XP_003292586.1 hypothetical protein DICPUDRAFT_157324 [Dictyostelium purpureum]
MEIDFEEYQIKKENQLDISMTITMIINVKIVKVINGIHISKNEGDIIVIGEANNSGSKSKLTITTFIALTIHSFEDGVEISSAFSSSQHVGLWLL